MKRIITIVFALAVLGLGGIRVLAHCQIPCGIYDDNMRFALMAEHITTIEKCMKEIIRLSGDTTANYNQLARWVANKDKHADDLSEIVAAYFMVQRVLPADGKDKAKYDKYVREITLLHQMLYHAMKAKQTTDFGEIKTLRELREQFQASYSGAPAQK